MFETELMGRDVVAGWSSAHSPGERWLKPITRSVFCKCETPDQEGIAALRALRSYFVAPSPARRWN